MRKNEVRICPEDKFLNYNIVIIDFLNVYMRFIKGNYSNMNEKTFLDFIDVISSYFNDKKIFFIKKAIWELPEDLLKKALIKHKERSIYFVIVSNKSDDNKYKERDDFVCYSLLNTLSSSIILSNDSKILNPKQIGNSSINVNILSLYQLPLDIEDVISKNCYYKKKGDYKRVVNFRFHRSD